ncbi:hypothetical protein [Lyngbya sp. PCC 8106]|uniref:hypothetical protein n=1 Tax=Lyngbya sp. (strain PCC 8106) TaxID=313612 RepID=UPI0000EAD627|nr:hypothetical protein [Lyngbya sp. PCC 8106]EAW37583.1 hypothetical protein L8106_16339 [Lyngbya sp. PCC 8106]
MQYTSGGCSGLVVSRLTFGAMTFGEGQLVPGVTNNIDQTVADPFPAWKAAIILTIQEQLGFSGFITTQVYYSLLG